LYNVVSIENNILIHITKFGNKISRICGKVIASIRSFSLDIAKETNFEKNR